MTEQRIKMLFNERITALTDDIDYYENVNALDLARESIEALKQILWLAHDFGVITFGEWEAFSGTLSERYYRTYDLKPRG